MRKHISALILAASSLLLSNTGNATTRTVNNTVTYAYNPGQYNSLTLANAAASNGDTILVAGSAVAYDAGGFTLTKRLVIIGPGYNPMNADRLPATISGSFTIGTAANGSVVMGLVFAGQLQAGSAPSNFTFRRNYFVANVGLNAGYTYTNFLFSENVIGQNCNVYFPANISCPNLVFRNNIFLGDAGNNKLQLPSSADYARDTIDHNLFIAGKYGTVNGTYFDNNNYGFILARNHYISNNIFLNGTALNNNNTSTGYINNYFFNNITYRSGSTMSATPTGTNYGSGNINNTNPLITTLFSSSTNVYLDFNADNLRLASGSPCLNAATDGTNIGPTGGMYPIYMSTNTFLTGEPPVPSIRSLSITSSTTVAPGTSISVSVTAKKIN